MDKYYVPDLSEFYVGFEYESKCPITNVWVKFIFKEDTHFMCKKDVRVKFLNKSDIESEGFKYDYAITDNETQFGNDSDLGKEVRKLINNLNNYEEKDSTHKV